MKPIACLAALALALAACGWNDDAPQNPRPRGPRHQAPTPNESARAPAVERSQPSDPLVLPVPAASPPAPEATGQKPAEEPERDYAGELRAAFGDPLACLKPRTGPDVPDAITIALNATVMTGGNISRGDVSSAQLDAEETRCLEAQLESRRIPGEVEDAPRSIQTSITLQRKKTEKSGE